MMSCESCQRPSECLILVVDHEFTKTLRVCPHCWPDFFIRKYKNAGEIFAPGAVGAK